MLGCLHDEENYLAVLDSRSEFWLVCRHCATPTLRLNCDGTSDRPIARSCEKHFVAFKDEEESGKGVKLPLAVLILPVGPLTHDQAWTVTFWNSKINGTEVMKLNFVRKAREHWPHLTRVKAERRHVENCLFGAAGFRAIAQGDDDQDNEEMKTDGKTGEKLMKNIYFRLCGGELVNGKGEVL